MSPEAELKQLKPLSASLLLEGQPHCIPRAPKVRLSGSGTLFQAAPKSPVPSWPGSCRRSLLFSPGLGQGDSGAGSPLFLGCEVEAASPGMLQDKGRGFSSWHSPRNPGWTRAGRAGEAGREDCALCRHPCPDPQGFSEPTKPRPVAEPVKIPAAHPRFKPLQQLKLALALSLWSILNCLGCSKDRLHLKLQSSCLNSLSCSQSWQEHGGSNRAEPWVLTEALSHPK